MGKSCVRFKKLSDLALDVIAEAIKRVPAKKYIEYCEAATRTTNKQAPASKRKTGTRAGSPKRARSGASVRKAPGGAK
jgi:hypothetical protein